VPDVLDRAMALFWRRGYEAASIRDLVSTTGINRGSLYATFGDKKTLFLAVLEHYADRIGKPLMAELANPDPRRAVEHMFAAIIQRTTDPRFPRGCLNTNTSLECPGSGDEITRKIAKDWAGRNPRFITCCAAPTPMDRCARRLTRGSLRDSLWQWLKV
jgi:TetR/AcrR family transcriptional regulator, transcriptional repressor for nem operon